MQGAGWKALQSLHFTLIVRFESFPILGFYLVWFRFLKLRMVYDLTLIFECFRYTRSVFVYHYSTISDQCGLIYSMQYDHNVFMLGSCDSFYKTIAMFCFLIKEDPSEATGVSLTSTTWTKQFVLLDEEKKGQTGEKEKPSWGHSTIHIHRGRWGREIKD